MHTDNRCLGAALAAFPFGNVVSLEPFGAGHINDTFAVYIQKYPEHDIGYILQRLNTNVFRQPREVMQNIMGVTQFLHEKLEAEGTDPIRGTLHFLQTWDGKDAFFDQEGMPWRSYRFIPNSFCHQSCATPDVFYESARAFGTFLRHLEDYPAETLHETIAGFHDTPSRFAQFKAALKADSEGRAATCQKEIDFVLAREEDCGILTRLQAAGRLPLRVTHNDTKLNNVLFDKSTGKAMCVIDLDTIMPGLALHDFGDSIRFGASTAAEDEQDISKVSLSLELFDVYTKGYLETAGPALTKTEIEYLPEGARIITLECGIRFLTDYLSGDTYFKTEREQHNLHRCRTQFKLVEEIEQHMDALKSIVARHAAAI